MQPSLLKVEISSTGAEMTEYDRTWDTRLTKTARKTNSPQIPLIWLAGVKLKWVLSHKLSLGGITLARSCFSLVASVG